MGKRKINQIKSIKRLSSVKDLALAFGTTEWFWRKMIQDGGLPHIRVGRKMFIDRLDLEEFINKNKSQN